MATRRDYRCPTCHSVQEIAASLLDKQQVVCSQCGVWMQRYFGAERPRVNYGFRENRYSNETDSNIAKYQFEHL